MLESRALRGAVAQLGERRVRNAKVEGSIPFRSTRFSSFFSLFSFAGLSGGNLTVRPLRYPLSRFGLERAARCRPRTPYKGDGGLPDHQCEVKSTTTSVRW